MASPALLLNFTRLEGDRFQMTCANHDGAPLARSEFEWRTETVAFEEVLKHLEALALDAKLRGSTFHSRRPGWVSPRSHSRK